MNSLEITHFLIAIPMALKDFESRRRNDNDKSLKTDVKAASVAGVCHKTFYKTFIRPFGLLLLIYSPMDTRSFFLRTRVMAYHTDYKTRIMCRRNSFPNAAEEMAKSRPLSLI